VIVWDVFLTIKASFEFFLHRIGSTGKRNWSSQRFHNSLSVL
jgi:hypothetical protein